MWSVILRFVHVAVALAIGTSLAACKGGAAIPSVPVPVSASFTRSVQSLPFGLAPFVVADAVSGSTPVAPLQLAWPRGAPQAGDVELACVESQYAVQPKAPIGWSALYQSANGFGTALFFKIATSNEAAAVTFSLPSSGNISVAMTRVAGANSAVPQFSHATVFGSTSSASTTPIVPASNGMLPLACFGGVHVGSYATASGWNSQTQTDGTYTNLAENRTGLTSGTTPVGTTASVTGTTSSTQIDAYEVLLAAPVATPPPLTSPQVVDAAGNSSPVAPMTLAWPKGSPQAGDLEVACVESQYQMLPKTPPGWTSLYGNASSFGTALFYHIAGTSEPASVTFSLGGAFNISAAMVRVKNAASSPPQYSHGKVTGTFASAATSPIVPTSIGALPLACFAGVHVSGYTVATGWSQAVMAGQTYANFFESRQSLTSVSDAAISVASSVTSQSSAAEVNAYGLVVASSNPIPIPQLFVSNSANNTVTEYPINNLTTSSPATTSSGVNDPSALAFNRAGDLFVANRSNSTVTKYPANNYTTASPTIISAGLNFCSDRCYPPALALDSAGDLFAANFQSVTGYPAGNLTTLTPTVISSFVFPTALAFDAADNLYVASCGSCIMTEVRLPDTVKIYPAGNYTTPTPVVITAGIDAPLGVAFDAAGNLFVLNHGSNITTGSVTKYPAGNLTTASPTVVNAGVSYPNAMALDAAGNLFVANCCALGPNNVTIHPANNLTTVSPAVISSGLSNPYALAFDGGGDLFVANQGNNTVTVYPFGNYQTSSPTIVSTGVHLPAAVAIH